MMQPRPQLLYFYLKRSSFVDKDIRILSEKYDVKEFRFYSANKAFTGWCFVQQLFFLLANLGKARVSVCFFSGYHAFLPAFFSRIGLLKCLIVAGGTDCVSFPAIAYGNFRKQPLAFFTAMAFKMAHGIAPVHERLAFYEYDYDLNMKGYQGITRYCPGTAPKIHPLNNGYDTSQWLPGPGKRIYSFITVAYDIGLPVINALKGIDLILEVAGAFPDHRFLLIGKTRDIEAASLPPNVVVWPALPQPELMKAFQESVFYLQLSISEGFPNALAEAMACGCVPIGSNVGGIPDIIGQTGFVLEHRSATELKEVLLLALGSDNQMLSIQARERISRYFSIEKRARELHELVAGCL